MFLFQTRENAEYLKANLRNPLLCELKSAAERSAANGPYSVVFSPPAAASGNPHDYFSMAPYWWEDKRSANPAIAPYVHHDGKRNPACLKFRHKQDFIDLSHTVLTLCTAGYFFNSHKYLNRASELIYIWFLNKETRMNPHLKYAQAIKNICDGRGMGIIELSALNRIVYAIAYLEAAGRYGSIIKNFNIWLSEMLYWLLTSRNGKEASVNGNNHESYYNVHLGIYALWLGQYEVVNFVCNNYKEKIIPNQIRSDGAMPAELIRTDSLGYSVYNLEALALLCEIGRMNGMDLWHHDYAGRSISKAIDYIFPTLTTLKETALQTDKLFLHFGSIRLQRPELERLNKIFAKNRPHWHQDCYIAPLCIMPH